MVPPVLAKNWICNFLRELPHRMAFQIAIHCLTTNNRGGACCSFNCNEKCNLLHQPDPRNSRFWNQVAWVCQDKCKTCLCGASTCQPCCTAFWQTTLRASTQMNPWELSVCRPETFDVNLAHSFAKTPPCELN